MRKLGVFERATLIANQHAPFNIVCVLRLKNAPKPEVLLQGARRLQLRHPLLRCRVIKNGGNHFFSQRETGDLDFILIENTKDEHWRIIAEQEMAHQINPFEEPLFRMTYLYTQGRGDLVFTLHHAIADAVSGMNLLDELLQFCANEDVDLPPLEIIEPPENYFPDQYQGIKRTIRLGLYAIREMGEMFSYLFRVRNNRKPPVRLGGSGKIVSIQLPEDLVDQLSHTGRKHGVTINSLLNATQVLAVNRHLYQNISLPMRTFSFASLRPFTNPPTPVYDLGSFISMLAFTLVVSVNEDVWQLAKSLHLKIYQSLKKGDRFNALLMSERLLRSFTRLKSMRFCSTALNYSSNVPLKSNYGEIKVFGMHGFVSGFDLGPEIASQARLFEGKIWWDFIYLDSDMDDQTASTIIEEIVKILEQAADKENTD